MLSQQVRNQIINGVTDNSLRVRKMDPQQVLSFLESEDYIVSQVRFYQSVFSDLGVDLSGKKILEIGAGCGFFLVYALRNLGWDISAIEPGEGEFAGRFEVCRTILKENGIDPDRVIRSFGENMPLAANSFDVVLSSVVLEHVKDPQKVLEESCWVLKPGGVLVFSVPNYRWIYEGHYNIPWFPFFSKPIAQKYVSWLGRDPKYIDHLNFLTPRKVKKIISGVAGIELCFPLEYKSFEFIEQRVKSYLLSAKKNDQKGAFVFFIKFLHMVISKRVCRAMLDVWAHLTGIYHEMHIVVRKKAFSV